MISKIDRSKNLKMSSSLGKSQMQVLSQNDHQNQNQNPSLEDSKFLSTIDLLQSTLVMQRLTDNSILLDLTSQHIE